MHFFSFDVLVACYQGIEVGNFIYAFNRERESGLIFLSRLWS